MLNNNEVVVNPAIDTTFDSLQEVYDLYNLHSWEIGFYNIWPVFRLTARGVIVMMVLTEWGRWMFQLLGVFADGQGGNGLLVGQLQAPCEQPIKRSWICSICRKQGHKSTTCPERGDIPKATRKTPRCSTCGVPEEHLREIYGRRWRPSMVITFLKISTLSGILANHDVQWKN